MATRLWSVYIFELCFPRRKRKARWAVWPLGVAGNVCPWCRAMAGSHDQEAELAVGRLLPALRPTCKKKEKKIEWNNKLISIFSVELQGKGTEILVGLVKSPQAIQVFIEIKIDVRERIPNMNMCNQTGRGCCPFKK